VAGTAELDAERDAVEAADDAEVAADAAGGVVRGEWPVVVQPARARARAKATAAAPTDPR